MGTHFEDLEKFDWEDTEVLVEKAFNVGLIKETEKEYWIKYVNNMYKFNYFYDPPHFYLNDNDEIVVPKSIKNFRGFMKQEEKEREMLQKNNAKTRCKIKIPKKLDTEEAKEILSKTIEIGLCDNNYKWLKSASLFGYYVDKVSYKLDIRNNNGRIDWKPFTTLFNISKANHSTARQKINDYKNKKLSPPEGDDLVNILLK